MNGSEALAFTDRMASGEFTPEELVSFQAYFRSVEDEEAGLLFDACWNALDKYPSEETLVGPDFLDRVIASLPDKRKSNVVPLPVNKTKRYRISPLGRIACAILLLTIAGYWWYNYQPSKKTIAPAIVEGPLLPEVPANASNFVLVLADGSQKILDTAQQGEICRQGNTSIWMDSGRIVLRRVSGKVAADASPQYNTLITPAGASFEMILQDSSHVWLNFSTAFQFPVSGDRENTLTRLKGEAYFHMMHDSSNDFQVAVGNTVVKDLGTRFDVMARGKTLKTTVLEGEVRVRIKDSVKVLTENQQAQVNEDLGQISVSDTTDVNTVITWTKGYFHFVREDLHSFIDQLVHWYNVRVRYERGAGKQPFFADGLAERSFPLRKVLDMFEKNQNLHFELKGDTIVVSPRK
jgi:transmembrane sensor